MGGRRERDGREEREREEREERKRERNGREERERDGREERKGRGGRKLTNGVDWVEEGVSPLQRENLEGGHWV